ncbi:MAG: 50S ribosomal protein L3 [Candidatus Adiutrix intracellularis]|nr:MAG: 50S ribosomal protein L3 [Candidatus Adiutrix intracellularis]MDR2826669.1 50S ribosomal protein L3 [Candidatus Adiutrix intracellularis]
MSKGLIGKKVGMTRIFVREGLSVPVTVIKAGPATVVQLKTLAVDGYEAVQLGFQAKNEKHSKKSEMGHATKAGAPGFKLLREFPQAIEQELAVGSQVTLDIFVAGEKISVTGDSKGRGFAGVMKRHGFHGGRATHGCLTPRGPGSIGCAADPSRVFPGRRMAGHTGHQRTTVKNLTVVDVRPEYGVILLRGAVPGPNGGLILLKKN